MVFPELLGCVLSSYSLKNLLSSGMLIGETACALVLSSVRLLWDKVGNGRCDIVDFVIDNDPERIGGLVGRDLGGLESLSRHGEYGAVLVRVLVEFVVVVKISTRVMGEG